MHISTEKNEAFVQPTVPDSPLRRHPSRTGHPRTKRTHSTERGGVKPKNGTLPSPAGNSPRHPPEKWKMRKSYQHVSMKSQKFPWGGFGLCRYNVITS